MTSTLSHRGPDDSGQWASSDNKIFFGHRRLSILDLSPGGHQPMTSQSERFTIVFNGEIYNFRDVRKKLVGDGHSFSSESDTEVMLHAFEAYGVAESLHLFNGMFAFALFDERERILWFVRDRFGVKPFYYSVSEQGIIFGSELKPFRKVPWLSLTIDRNALARYIQYCYVPSPWSIYQNIYKLPAGTHLSIPIDRFFDWKQNFSPFAGRTTSSPHRYWCVREAIEGSIAQPFQGSEEEAVNEVSRIISDSVRLRMVSDVPLGAFLSGGIDSSTVVAFMREHTSIPVKTFTIGFHEAEYDEARYAREVAKQLGTDHTELYLTPQDTLNVIPYLPTLFDEPFADSSQIPTYLISRLARESVTVTLSGDGGDEFFGGYNRYQWGHRLWRCLSHLPYPLRTPIGAALVRTPTRAVERLVDKLAFILPKYLSTHSLGEKIRRLGELLHIRERRELYVKLLSFWEYPERVVNGAHLVETEHTKEFERLQFLELMMFLDTTTYLTDDILVKVDRASMGVSLEAREPLLDYRLFEFAWTLPRSFRTRGDTGKWILRRALERHLPRTLFDRPKMGFAVPIAEWLRGPLREWCEDLLSHERLTREGFFHPEPIREEWRKHLTGKRDRSYLLWCILMFERWLEETKA